MKVKSKADLKLALLDIAEGLRDELSLGDLGGYIPATMLAQIEAIAQKAWEALEHPSVQDAADIRKAVATKPPVFPKRE